MSSNTRPLLNPNSGWKDLGDEDKGEISGRRSLSPTFATSVKRYRSCSLFLTGLLVCNLVVLYMVYRAPYVQIGRVVDDKGQTLSASNQRQPEELSQPEEKNEEYNNQEDNDDNFEQGDINLPGADVEDEENGEEYEKDLQALKKYKGVLTDFNCKSNSGLTANLVQANLKHSKKPDDMSVAEFKVSACSRVFPQCKMECPSGRQVSEISLPKLPIFIKTHKVGGSQFGSALRRAADKRDLRNCNKDLEDCDWGSSSHHFEEVYKCCGTKAFATMCSPAEKHVYMTIVREPLDHLLSYFFYSMGSDLKKYSAKSIAKNGPPKKWLSDFTEWLEIKDGDMRHRRSLLGEFFRASVIRESVNVEKDGTTTRNPHPMFDEMDNKCRHLRKEHVAWAKKELAHFQVIGLQEDLDASLVWAAHELEWDPLELSYDRSAYSHREDTPPQGVDVENMRRKVTFSRPKTTDLPQQLVDAIKNTTRFQLETEFFQYARSLHMERTKKFPKFREEVEKFVNTCNEGGIYNDDDDEDDDED
eukprot:m.49876 g.49876  ORF g.49876 m.49876 type:complete len:530 (+) comp10635_c0_seq2:157-1746(+)